MVTVSLTKTELWDVIFFLFYLNLKAKATFLIISHTLNYYLITDLYRKKNKPFLPFLNIFPENALFEIVSGSDNNSRLIRPTGWARTQSQGSVLKMGVRLRAHCFLFIFILSVTLSSKNLNLVVT